MQIQGGDYEHVASLIDGSSLAAPFTYQRANLGALSKLVLNGGEFDAAEYSMANLIMLHARGDRGLRAIPVFPSRAFRNVSVFVSEDSPLCDVAQLEGKRVGVSEFAMTTAVWTRGQLQDRFGFDWRSVEWVTAAKQRFPLPADIRSTQVEGDREDLLCAGKLDAVMTGRPKLRRLRNLLTDPEAVESEYFVKTGVFPIMHTVVLHPRVIQEGVARQLFDAYADSKKTALSRRASAGFLPGAERLWDRCRANGFESVRYGLTPLNRQTIGTLSRYLHEQGLIDSQPALESLFVTGAPDWVDAS